MAKVSKKPEKVTAFGRIIFVLGKFDSIYECERNGWHRDMGVCKTAYTEINKKRQSDEAVFFVSDMS
ncbi:MAG: hypothetical protein K5757_10100 [Bacteroidaceae bacterium]|nr:hypothetical protein [Bacteroidaceae bacterium]